MHSNVMTADHEMIEANDALYGTTKINYNPISLGLAGGEKLHDVGSLQERSHTSVSYNLAEQFPADQIASALKPTMTELAQVTAVSSEFKFCQYAKGVEFKLSNLNGISSTNIEAGINKELWKEWDKMVFDGQVGNEGYRGNSKGNYITAAAALTFATLTAEIDGAISRIKAVSGITSDELGALTLVHDDAITAVLRSYPDGSEISNLERFTTLYPSLVLVEAPSNIMASGGPGEFILVARDMVTLHRASVPALYARESGKYNMSQDSLFTYESAGVECEIAGAIQGVVFPA